MGLQAKRWDVMGGCELCINISTCTQASYINRLMPVKLRSKGRRGRPLSYGRSGLHPSRVLFSGDRL